MRTNLNKYTINALLTISAAAYLLTTFGLFGFAVNVTIALSTTLAIFIIASLFELIINNKTRFAKNDIYIILISFFVFIYADLPFFEHSVTGAYIAYFISLTAILLLSKLNKTRIFSLIKILACFSIICGFIILILMNLNINIPNIVYGEDPGRYYMNRPDFYRQFIASEK